MKPACPHCPSGLMHHSHGQVAKLRSNLVAFWDIWQLPPSCMAQGVGWAQTLYSRGPRSLFTTSSVGRGLHSLHQGKWMTRIRPEALVSCSTPTSIALFSFILCFLILLPWLHSSSLVFLPHTVTCLSSTAFLFGYTLFRKCECISSCWVKRSHSFRCMCVCT
jgi:hypothetical protein